MKLKAQYVSTLASCLLLYPALCSTAAAALPAPVMAAAPSAAVDQGLADQSAVVAATVSLAPANLAALQDFIASTVDPASPNYHQFLTPAQFAARFGQPAGVVRRVVSQLQAMGLSVTKIWDNKLLISVKGTNAQLANAFGTSIHSFVENGASYQKPVGGVTIPASISDVVTSVVGLSTRQHARAHLRQADSEIAPPAKYRLTPSRPGVQRAAAVPTPGLPGSYNVADVASKYNITPLYNRGLDGTGVTLGIMTFASFNVADAGAYWAAYGINSDTSRVTVINVDDGAGGVISSSGGNETSLDVEQSGGLAPKASIRVYVAPNTDAGAIALYAQAINDNVADTLSISWGESELYYGTSDLAPYDVLFMQSAAQGVPISASSGDEAAFDLNYSGAYPYPTYSTVVSLDYPSSSPYIVSAGGTTLPTTLTLSHGNIVIPYERPWAWDYILDYLVSYSATGQSTYYKSDFPVGGGGGVSVMYPVPSYQQGLAGVQTSAPGQSLLCFKTYTGTAYATCTAGTYYFTLPAGYAGRNSPDVSLNADPETGYSLYYNSTWYTGYGGTSFVAPQLNGIFALLTQQASNLHGTKTRVGYPHPQLYSAFKSAGYGSTSPFKAIGFGDNLFYTSGATYNPATGLGALNVDNLSNFLGR